MSNQFKEELAKELGFYDVVQKEGWGGIRAKDAGNMVKRAIYRNCRTAINETKPVVVRYFLCYGSRGMIPRLFVL